MRWSRTRAVRWMAAVLGIWLATPAVAVTQYTYVELPSLGGGSRGLGLNDAGQVVGESWAQGQSDSPVPVIWDGGVLAALPTGSHAGGSATAINGNGTIAGYLRTGDQAPVPVVWRNGQIDTYLGAVGGVDTVPEAINDSGVVVGTAQSSDPYGPSNALRWSQGVAQDLGNLDWPWSEAHDVNSAGQIVGWARYWPWNPDAMYLPCLWENGTIRQLDVSPAVDGYGGGQAWAINEAGQIVGTLNGAAVFWENGQATLLTETGFGAVARDINDLGQIVGGIGSTAVLWEDGQAYDLHDLLDPAQPLARQFIGAIAVNNAGQILVNGVSRSYLLTPVPEPGSLALLGAACVLWRRRQ